MISIQRMVRRRGQRGGILPLAAVIPTLTATGKTAALAALGSLVGHKTKKWLEKKKYKKRPTQRKNQKGSQHARR